MDGRSISRVRIGKVVFRLIGGDEVKKGASTHVFRTKWQEGEEGAANGVQDLRMGAINSREVCLECRQTGNYCPGHFGYIDLTQNMYNCITMDYLIRVLRVVCLNCGNLLIQVPPNIMSYPPQQRFQYIVKKTPKFKKCVMCGFVQPFFRKTPKEYIIYCVEETKKTKTAEKSHREFKTYADHVYSLLNGQFNKDILPLLGMDPSLNSFSSLLLRHFPVLPRCARPTSMPGTRRMENVLTISYKKALEHKNKLDSENMRANTSLRMSHGSFVNAIVISMIDYNKAAKIPRLGNVGLTGPNSRTDSFMTRLRGKQGILRAHTNGKRIDNAGRTVISPGASYGPKTIGVPISFCMSLIRKRVVSEANYNDLMTRIRNGPHKHPGATMIQKSVSGALKSVELINFDNFTLEYGDIVHCHLDNGDKVIVNRQPTLHKHGMVAGDAILTPHNTIRFPPSAVKGPNADFDGDDMNIYCVRTIGTDIEAGELLSAENIPISMGHGSCLIGALQDDISACFCLTRKRTVLSKKELNYVLLDTRGCPSTFPPPAGTKDGVPFWTGKQAFSFILPATLNYKKKTSDALLESPDFEKEEDEVVITNGQLLKGVITAAEIGQGKTGSLVHVIYNYYGGPEMSDFIYNIQAIAYNFNMLNGFTVSMGDTRLPDTARAQIAAIIEKYKAEYAKYLKLLDDGVLIAPPGVPTGVYFEELVNTKVFQPMDSETLKIAMKNLNTYDNGFAVMVKSGAKGNDSNIQQSSVLIGQQRIAGARLAPTFDGTRCDPSDTKYDMSIGSMGFIERNYSSGMRVRDFVNHGEAGRVGLVDTANKTQQGGYAQRRMEKGTEGDVIANDLSVRTSLDNIIQYIYGGNGSSVEKTEPVECLLTKISSMKDFVKTYSFETGDAALAKLCKEEFERLLELRAMIVECNTHITVRVWDAMEKIHCSCNPMKLVYMYKGKGKKVPIVPADYLKFVSHFFARELPGTLTFADVDSHPRGILYKVCCLTTEAITRGMLSLKQVLSYGLTQGDIDLVYGSIKYHFIHSIASPGEMIGVATAESIGEAGTQLVLKTFHFAGMGGEKTNISQGIDAFTKLIYLKLANEPQNSTLTIYLDKEHETSRPAAEEVVNKIKSVVLKDLDFEPTILYVPDLEFTNEDDAKLYSKYVRRKTTDSFPSKDVLNPYVVKILFKRQMLANESISVAKIASVFAGRFPHVHVAASDLADKNQIMLVFTDLPLLRTEMKKTMKKAKRGKSDTEIDALPLTEMFAELLQTQIVRGIPGIVDPVISERKEKVINADGDIVAKSVFMIKTIGNNLSSILYIENIDTARTFTDSPAQIFQIFGVEGLRSILISTFYSIYMASNAKIDFRHFNFLADVLLRTGTLGGIHRAKLRSAHDAGPLLELSFENQSSAISNAAIFSHEDNMRSPSASIQFGQTFEGGTCYSDILFDNTPRGLTLEQIDKLTA